VSDGPEGRIGPGVSLREVGPGVKGGGEEEVRPLQAGFRVKDLSL